MLLNVYTENEVNLLVNQRAVELNLENSGIIVEYTIQVNRVTLIIPKTQKIYIHTHRCNCFGQVNISQDALRRN